MTLKQYLEFALKYDPDLILSETKQVLDLILPHPIDLILSVTIRLSVRPHPTSSYRPHPIRDQAGVQVSPVTSSSSLRSTSLGAWFRIG
jgi:hypothetical protein